MQVLVLAALVCGVAADIYLQVPRGSNNRLNEPSANRDNANRLFDSQNNNRGGYNVGDLTDGAFEDEEGQYRMKYFQSDETGQSVLRVEWTNQHGCGGNEDDNPQKQNCNIVMQYACQDDLEEAVGETDSFRNGAETNRQPWSRTRRGRKETREQRDERKYGDVLDERGVHEAWDNYDKCNQRIRNKGLFLADQDLSGKRSRAVNTRQNRNGQRFGYECPEERDYFPYWHPTMWNDIAVLGDLDRCPYYLSESGNVKSRWECHRPTGWANQNNEADCGALADGTWVEKFNYLEKAALDEAACAAAGHIWGVAADSLDPTEECLVRLPAPDCRQAPWSRSNHLGNAGDGVDAAINNNYDWALPHFPSGNAKRCVFRIRYNISTDDYDPWNTFAASNGDNSPVTGNPQVDIGAGNGQTLQLAINTAQFGRTFQDRSHVFVLRPRPAELAGARIVNLNVRGKRGNIVQTFPATEYDFAPTSLELTEGDLVHVQETGSNTHDNGNPAGDGQAGDAGEGEGGTDRHNIVQILTRNDNFPVPYEQTTLWSNARLQWIYHGATGVSAEDLALDMATSGFYRCKSQATCPAGIAEFAVDAAGRGEELDGKLNNAFASYEGAVLRLTPGTYHYMSTRNNNFTNRSQKASIVVKAA